MRRWLYLTVLLGTVFLVGCTRDQNAEVREATQGVRQELRDVTLASKVKTALATRKGLEGTKIDVETTGPNVTLKGDVNTREQAEIAERVARETEGVQSVSNELMLRVPAKRPGTTVLPGTPARG